MPAAGTTRSGRRRRRVGSRPATYHSATRLARIAHGLHERPQGWSFEAICRELNVSERTLLRYLAALRRDLRDAGDRPLVEVVRRGHRRLLKLVDGAYAPTASSWQAMSLYFALTVFQFLEGTVIKDGVDDLWQAFLHVCPPDRTVLQHLDRKFYTVPWAVKDYRGSSDQLDAILQGVARQRRLRIVYAGLWRDPDPGGEETVHQFDPYTLAMYRGGLYLIGRSDRHRHPIYLAVERIRSAEQQRGQEFAYPRRYSPASLMQGTFGIVEGPETRVELEVIGRKGAALLESRRLHPTQRFERRGGSLVLTMTVRGTSELLNWILSLGPHVKVRRPAALRREVRDALTAAAHLYGA